MAQLQTYKKLRTEPNGDVILERNYADEVTKKEILGHLNEELKSEQQARSRAVARITRLQNRIATIEAL